MIDPYFLPTDRRGLALFLAGEALRDFQRNTHLELPIRCAMAYGALNLILAVAPTSEAYDMIAPWIAAARDAALGSYGAEVERVWRMSAETTGASIARAA